MSAKHTPGRLYIRTNRHPNTDGTPWGWVDLYEPGSMRQASPEGIQVTWSRGQKSEANARRLVACWNLLLPFTTEQIETFQCDVLELAAQRDELLAALRMVMACAGDISAAPDGLLEMALDDGDEETRRQANAFLVARAAIRERLGEKS